MGGFPSGQRGQTVNLLQLASVVRIHLRPFNTRFRNVSCGILFAQIAQLVEQRTENPRVTGSIPVLGIFFICGNVLRSEGAWHRKSQKQSPRYYGAAHHNRRLHGDLKKTYTKLFCEQAPNEFCICFFHTSHVYSRV